MIDVIANRSFPIVVTDGLPGLVGQITIEIYDLSNGAVVLAPTTAGITEPRPGTYYTTRSLSTVGQHQARWQMPNGVTAEETINVHAEGGILVAPGVSATTYATVDDFRAYVTDSSPLSALPDDRIQTALGRAERDIDSQYSWRPYLSTGLRFDPTAITESSAFALNRATCAQAEYRLVMGDEFFVAPRYKRVSGPDFSTEGEAPFLGPQAQRELGSVQDDGSGIRTITQARGGL